MKDSKKIHNVTYLRSCNKNETHKQNKKSLREQNKAVIK